MGYQLVVGPDGELSLPETVRDALGLKPGDVVRVEVDPAGHSLTMSKDQPAPVTRNRYPIEDIFGIGGKAERTVSAEDVKQIVRQRAVERFLRK